MFLIPFFQVFPTLRKERLILSVLIIGVAPRERAPFFFRVHEGRFGEDTVAQVDSVRVILRRGENEFAELDITGIEVKGSRSRGASFGIELRADFFFPEVCLYLNRRKLAGIDESLKDPESLRERVGHFFLVILSEVVKTIDFAL